MKNPDLMMYRVAIGQILADAGINRSTILEMVKETITEKVTRQISQNFQQTVREATSDYKIREALHQVLTGVVHSELARMRVEINITENPKEC